MGKRAKTLLHFLVMANLVACATYYDRDMQNPGYYNGSRVTPPEEKVGTLNRGLAEQLAEGVVFGVIAASTLLANPGYYRSSAISGRCTYYSSSDSNIEVPCLNEVIVLKDAGGEEVGRSELHEGRFGFFVELGKSYTLDVLSQAYQVHREDRQQLAMGDRLILRLVPRQGSHGE